MLQNVTVYRRVSKYRTLFGEISKSLSENKTLSSNNRPLVREYGINNF
jgi:hypothetical protein